MVEAGTAGTSKPPPARLTAKPLPSTTGPQRKTGLELFRIGWSVKDGALNVPDVPYIPDVPDTNSDMDWQHDPAITHGETHQIRDALDFYLEALRDDPDNYAGIYPDPNLATPCRKGFVLGSADFTRSNLPPSSMEIEF